MKKILVVFIFVFSTFISCTEEITTYYLIRHAEKNRTDTINRNPNLNEEGLERAKKWADYFKDIKLDAVYSTKYNRTIQTAKPTSDSKSLEILTYNPRNMYDSIFQKSTKGKTVLVVGHSNTTPFFANKIFGKEKYKQMDDRDNASLYIVTIKGKKKTTTIEKVE